MESFMNTGSSDWQWGQRTNFACEGGMMSSSPQRRHLKCIIGVMKPLLVLLVVASSVWAQSVADVARKERERQSKTRSTHVITSVEATKVEEPKPTPTGEQTKPGEQAKSTEQAKPAEDAKAGATPLQPSKETPKPQAPPAVDPVQPSNKQLDQLRTKIRALMDQETSLLLQLNQANNQVYAPVTDPPTQERALALVGQIQQQVEAVRKDLSEAKAMLDAMQLQGPPKK